MYVQGGYHFIQKFHMERQQTRNLFYCEMEQHNVRDLQAILAVYNDVFLSHKYIRQIFSFIIHTLNDD